MEAVEQVLPAASGECGAAHPHPFLVHSAASVETQPLQSWSHPIRTLAALSLSLAAFSRAPCSLLKLAMSRSRLCDEAGVQVVRDEGSCVRTCAHGPLVLARPGTRQPVEQLPPPRKRSP